MTSLMEFKPKELPTFGALNVNWEMFAGTEKPEAGYGVNTYGDTHFLLDKDKVGSRLVYTATDHGVPRRDPLLAVSDFAFGGSLTELTDVKNESMVNQIVNAALGNAKVVSNLPFEIQIFGTVDIARDLEKIYASPSVSKTVKDNLAAFQKLTGIECEILTPPRDFAAQVIPTHLKRPELLKAALAKQRISSTRVSEVEAEGNEPVRAFKALAYYILKQTPRSKNDKEAMRGALGELTTLLGFLPPAQQTAAIIKLHNDIKDYVVKVAP
jgi:hypothetical protein